MGALPGPTGVSQSAGCPDDKEPTLVRVGWSRDVSASCAHVFGVVSHAHVQLIILRGKGKTRKTKKGKKKQEEKREKNKKKKKRRERERGGKGKR